MFTKRAHLARILTTAAALCAATLLLEAGARAADDSYWAFQRPLAAPVPKVKNEAWVKTPIDAFILARLEKQGLSPAPAADRRVLIRRLTFDLTGLPPTPEEVRTFLNDRGPDAYEKLVDRLLASPHYGERWAQFWLDVVRYADSDGFEYDDPRPDAWRYRDWVIRSFNQDLPYDKFVELQIAGDELQPENHEALAATGFNRLGPLRLNAGNQDEEKNRQEVLVEMTDAVGSTFLGLTVGCARCHDHKFDPIPQADYYRLQAFFAATQGTEVSVATAEEQATHDAEMEAWKGEIASLRREIAEIDRGCRERLLTERQEEQSEAVQAALAIPESERSAEQKKLVASAAKALGLGRDEISKYLTPSERERRDQLRKKMRGMRREEPDPLPAVWAVADTMKDVPPTYLLIRGQPGHHGQVVEPRLPSAAADDPALGVPVGGAKNVPGPGGQTSTGRRTALARWLGSKDNPLAARVMVNRLWQHHFQRGIVSTPNDFGLMGDPPTHPELLDWLAVQFMQSGWSMKAMHRLIVTSATYRQSSHAPADTLKADPENKLWSRMPRTRLDAEALRDSILAVAGTLNLKAGGPGVRLPLIPEIASLVYKGSWEVTPDKSEYTRRTIYRFVKRNLPNPYLESFDEPGTMVSCSVRTVSTHAGQALAQLNSPFITEQAQAFANRLLRDEAGPNGHEVDIDAIVERAYQLALARPPRTEEIELARNYLDQQTKYLRQQDAHEEPTAQAAGEPNDIDPYFADALADYALVILNLDEFLFVD